MRQINPVGHALADKEANTGRRSYGMSKWVTQRKKMWKYLSASHKYERRLSDKPTGETRVMLGYEAKALNDRLEKEFIAQLSANVKGRSLERWKLVERDVEPEEEK